MPPFAPHHYMEPPAYILPHPPLQPVDYRRFLPPQVHAAPAGPYQNTAHGRRVRLPNAAPLRETVNSAVQTEPTQRSVDGYTDVSPPVRSDSGHGSATDSPSSSCSVTNKRLAAELENYISTNEKARALQMRACTGGAGRFGLSDHMARPTELKSMQSNFKATVASQKCHKDGQDDQPAVYKHSRRNMWSVDSQDSMIPVCSSSQQEEETTKERRSSFPDILMSWAAGSPQAPLPVDTDKVLGRDANRLRSDENQVNPDQLDCQSPKGADAAGHEAKILSIPKKLPEFTRTKGLEFAGSVRQCLAFADEPMSDKCLAVSGCGQERPEENSLEEPPEVIPYEMVFNSSTQSKRKLNESVWSVESLCPFIPSKDWAQHRSVLESEIIIETTEEPKDEGASSPSGDLVSKLCKEMNQSVTESVPVSDSWLVYDTPAQKMTVSKQPEFSLDPSVVQEPAQNSCPPVEDLLTMLRTEEVDEDGSSEPEVDGRPQQEPAPEPGQPVGSSCPPHQREPLPVNSVERQEAAAPAHTREGALLPTGLCVPSTEQGLVGLSPSKGHLVDFGVQCSKLLPCANDCCEEPFRKHLKYSGTLRGAVVLLPCVLQSSKGLGWRHFVFLCLCLRTNLVFLSLFPPLPLQS